MHGALHMMLYIHKAYRPLCMCMHACLVASSPCLCFVGGQMLAVTLWGYLHPQHTSARQLRRNCFYDSV